MRIETIRLAELEGRAAAGGLLAGSEATLTAYLLDDVGKCEVVPRAAVIVCPGGAYTHLADREAEPVAMAFAAAGCQAFVLRYSLGQASEPAPGEVAQAAFPRCLDELAASVALVRERAAGWDVDPGRVFVCGFSAGGHLALMLATTWQAQAERMGLGDEPELVRPSGEVLGYPLADVSAFADLLEAAPANSTSHAVQVGRAASRAMYGTTDPTREQILALSPVQLVSSQMPPAFVWGTGEDRTVDPRGAVALAGACLSHGVPCELHLFERGPHGMSLASPVVAGPGGTRVDADAAQWLDLAIRWIRRH